MKKYIDLFGFVPVIIIVMCFMKTETELNNHLKKSCISLVINLLVSVFVYLLLMYFRVDKWISIFTSLILWFVLSFLKRYLITNL